MLLRGALPVLIAVFTIFTSPTISAPPENQNGVSNCPKPSLTSSAKLLSNGKKYFFKTNGLTWNKAKKHCEDNKMHLPSIGSLAQLEEIHATAKAIDGNVWWVAANDVEQGPGNFKWENGNDLELDSSWWREGQPRSYRTANESCVFFSTHFDEKLWDGDCDFIYYSVCELNDGC
ncbi:Hypothetical predicted protein [Cloeon dipterum]|uniref:C-type lectin domain-containing protein n=1 Tax=Cloeon dipterum TaxID=197152 RepID=A0A8S1DLA8_9INSE|nr:Hypothetical predicted protein [Cloeon dipterum]